MHTFNSTLICQCVYNENYWTEEGMNLLMQEYWQLIDAVGEDLKVGAKL